MTTTGKTGNWKFINGNGSKPDDPMDALINTHTDILHGFNTHTDILHGFAAELDVVNHLTQMTNDLPDELQPVGEVLTNASTKILSGSYVECLKFLAEMGFQEIAQATKPGGQHQQ
jgi:hypothetical protein